MKFTLLYPVSHYADYSKYSSVGDNDASNDLIFHHETMKVEDIPYGKHIWLKTTATTRTFHSFATIPQSPIPDGIDNPGYSFGGEKPIEFPGTTDHATREIHARLESLKGDREYQNNLANPDKQSSHKGHASPTVLIDRLSKRIDEMVLREGEDTIRINNMSESIGELFDMLSIVSLEHGPAGDIDKRLNMLDLRQDQAGVKMFKVEKKIEDIYDQLSHFNKFIIEHVKNEGSRVVEKSSLEHKINKLKEELEYRSKEFHDTLQQFEESETLAEELRVKNQALMADIGAVSYERNTLQGKVAELGQQIKDLRKEMAPTAKTDKKKKKQKPLEPGRVLKWNDDDKPNSDNTKWSKVLPDGENEKELDPSNFKWVEIPEGELPSDEK